MGSSDPCITADLLRLLWGALVLQGERSLLVCAGRTAINPPRPQSPSDSPPRLRPPPRPGRPSGRRPRPRHPLALRRGFPATFRVVRCPPHPPHPPRRMLGGSRPRAPHRG